MSTQYYVTKSELAIAVKLTGSSKRFAITDHNKIRKFEMEKKKKLLCVCPSG